MPQQNPAVTETELAILNVLWDQGPVTVRELVETIYGKHKHSLHAGVKSLLKRLDDKGYVASQRQGIVHLFSATVPRAGFVAQQLQQLADNNFGGSLTPLLATLVNNVKLSRKDRDAIRKIIEKID